MTRFPGFDSLAVLLLGSALTTAIGIAWEQQVVRADGRGAVVFGIVVAICALLRYFLRSPKNERARIVRDLAEYFGCFLLLCVIGAIASYPAAAASLGMVDKALARIDRLLGFDWVWLYQLVADHRSLQLIGIAAYQSIYATPALILGYFAWTRRRETAHDFLLAFWLAAIMTLIIFRWLPAAGPLDYLWSGPIPYMPQSALYQAHIIPALQHHLEQSIDVDELRGLVSVPSFHAASATLYIAFARAIPRIGKPLVALNILMLCATPIEGTHYLIDVIGGIAVALIAIGVVAMLRRRQLVP